MVTKASSTWVRTPFDVLTTNNPAASPSVTRQFGIVYQLDKTRTGSSNPNWRQQVKSNVGATTFMTGQITTLTCKVGRAVAISPREITLSPGRFMDLYENYEGCAAARQFSGVPSAPGGSDSVARNMALNRLYQAIRSQSTHFSGGTFLGELKESLGTIRNVARKVANLIPSHLAAQQKLIKRYVGSYVIGPNGSAVRVKDFNPRKGKRLPASKWKELQKGLADNWLEYAFGIRPLVNDVRDAAETIARYQNDNVHEKVRGYGNSTTVTSDAVTNLNFGLTHLNGQFRWLRKNEIIVVYRCGLQFSVSSPAFGTAARLQGLMGFKLEDFVPTVWNLLPYSFLLDYFVNVGDILNAITTDTSSVRWINESVVRQGTWEGTTRVRPDMGDGIMRSGDFGSAVLSTRSVQRQAGALTIPLPEFQIPGLLKADGSFNQQWVNMVALLSGGKGARRGF